MADLLRRLFHRCGQRQRQRHVRGRGAGIYGAGDEQGDASDREAGAHERSKDHAERRARVRAAITRFLRHPSTSSGQALQAWRDADDIQAVHGPPDLLDPPDEPGGDEGDGVDDLQPLEWVA